MKKDEKKIYLI